MPTRLAGNALRRRIDPSVFLFETTAELPVLKKPLSQPRVLKALEFGLAMGGQGYNIFVLGPPGAGKHSLTLNVLEDAALQRPVPSDWVYLFNFRQPEEPRALSLSAGLGGALRADLEALVSNLLLNRPETAGEAGREAIRRELDAVAGKYESFPPVVKYLEEVEHDALGAPGLEDRVGRYRVNVFVSNQGLAGAPVVYEPNPTYANLLGRLDQRLHQGSLATDFTLLRAGALHRANGGYLVLNARDLLANPAVYDALKRVLQERRIRLEDPGEPFRALPAATLRPEPIVADVKVVLLGTQELYYLLYEYDEDFGKFFKVKGEFADDLALCDESRMGYALLISHHCAAEGLLPFHRGAVARVVEQGLRIAEYQDRLSANFLAITDLVREADLWARKDGDTVVGPAHVTKAVEARTYLNSYPEEIIGRMIEEGSILIDTEGTALGQANGLSVYDLGDYAFGKPSRLTAKVFLGREGVINIEREADLAGRIHNKGVLILQGYFGSRYAQKFPISFAATLCFEQSYGGVEGDSASSVELFALLSALAEIPLRQDLAVTGSVNQMGQIQAVGGINLKIEGFYNTCKVRGLTGTQGVIIPRANVRNLMLEEDVVDAVDRGEFHIYPVSTVEEGMDLLSGIPAGEANLYGEFPEGTLNAKITRRLERLSRQWKKLHSEE